MITFSTTDNATDALRAKTAKLTPKRVYAFVGPRVANLVRVNFEARPANKKGWPTTGYWAACARSTTYQLAGSDTVISISKIGVRQRFQGGIIRPVNAKALTIPVCAAAYGKVASEFPGTFIVKTKEGKAFIARKLEGGKIELLFQLVAQVDQKADPSVLPTPEAIRAEIKAGITEALA